MLDYGLKERMNMGAHHLQRKGLMQSLVFIVETKRAWNEVTLTQWRRSPLWV